MDRDTSGSRSSPLDESIATTSRESLKQVAKRLQAALRDSNVAVSIEVMRMADDWDHYRSEAGDLEISSWVVKELDPDHGLDWYRTLAEAAAWIGNGTWQRLRSAALRWLWDRVRPSEAKLDKIRQIVGNEYKRNRDAPVSLNRVKKLFAEHIARRPEGKRGIALREARERAAFQEARCGRLEEQVRALGGEPVE